MATTLLFEQSVTHLGRVGMFPEAPVTVCKTIQIMSYCFASCVCACVCVCVLWATFLRMPRTRHASRIILNLKQNSSCNLLSKKRTLPRVFNCMTVPTERINREMVLYLIFCLSFFLFFLVSVCLSFVLSLIFKVYVIVTSTGHFIKTLKQLRDRKFYGRGLDIEAVSFPGRIITGTVVTCSFSVV